MEPPINNDIENEKNYGNCTLFIHTNRSTKTKSYSLWCWESTSTDRTGIAIYQSPPREFELHLIKGKMSHSEDSKISIKLRIDEGKWISETAWWNPKTGYAKIRDTKLALSVMNAFANEGIVAFEIEEKSGEITCNDDAKVAVKEFSEGINCVNESRRIAMKIARRPLPILTVNACEDLRMPPSIDADTSSSFKLENEKEYGNCLVMKYIDSYSDAESHHLLCGRSTPNKRTIFYETEVGIQQSEPKKLELHLNIGDMSQSSHSGREIPIVLTIDKVEVINGNARWHRDPGFASIEIKDTKLAVDVMDKLAHGKRVTIEVGKETGSIKLDSASEAVQYFRDITNIDYP